MRNNFKSKISFFFWGGAQPLPRPQPREEGRYPLPTPYPLVAFLPLATPATFPEILDPPLLCVSLVWLVGCRSRALSAQIVYIMPWTFQMCRLGPGRDKHITHPKKRSSTQSLWISLALSHTHKQ